MSFVIMNDLNGGRIAVRSESILSVREIGMEKDDGAMRLPHTLVCTDEVCYRVSDSLDDILHEIMINDL